MKTILFQGDSITDAWRSREDDNAIGIGYPMLVRAELAFDNPNKYKFLNRGIGGNRTVDLYARIKSDIINLNPDILSILIGVNDVWHEIEEKNGVDTEKYFKIYSMLIEEVKEALPDIKIMILEPFVLKGSGTEKNWDYFKSEVVKRAEKSREIARKYNLIFVPLQEKFTEIEDIYLSCTTDGVHPNFIGQELIKREWLKAFKKL